MTTLYCAECGARFEPDDDHIWIEAEHKLMNDRNSVDDYAFHPDCYRQVTAEWSDPA